jgi:ribosomal-protein-alanine N-acetyltransferase
MQKELVFLRLKEEHLDRVLEIENASFPKPWTREMFEREIALVISNFYIVKIDADVVAYGGYWLINDEAHMVNIAVAPQARRNGIGKNLLDFLIGKMERQNAKRILLEVRAGNNDAIKLYENTGFINSGLRPKYYGQEDALLMEKIIEKVSNEVH